MKRSVKTPSTKKGEKKSDPRPRWKKLGGGIHNHRDGQIVRKGGILRAWPDELSTILKTKFKCIDVGQDESLAPDAGFRILVKERDDGMYDLFNSINMVKINGSPLTQEEAEKFAPEDSLEEGEDPYASDVIEEEEE